MLPRIFEASNLLLQMPYHPTCGGGVADWLAVGLVSGMSVANSWLFAGYKI